MVSKPEFIRQWDDLPEDFSAESLTLGSVIEWPGYSRLTVVAFEPNKLLRLSLYVPKWQLQPTSYDIAYTYTLSVDNENTLLSIEIGDFAQLSDGERYYEESLTYGNIALEKIKELSEQ
ncbi:MAG: SRPBCC domain-containing protein [Bacillota bacterium]